MCTPNTGLHIFLLSTPANTALCWSRGASRYFRNHAGSCRGQREGGSSVEGGTPGQHHLNQGGAFEAGQKREKSVERKVEDWGGCD